MKRPCAFPRRQPLLAWSHTARHVGLFAWMRAPLPCEQVQSLLDAQKRIRVWMVSQRAGLNF